MRKGKEPIKAEEEKKRKRNKAKLSTTLVNIIALTFGSRYGIRISTSAGSRSFISRFTRTVVASGAMSI